MYIKNSNVGDVWRIANRTGREYSFHSQVHNVYTHIDYFLVDFKLIPFTFNATYHNILISDHSPVTFSLKLSEIVTSQPLWRADPYLLKDTKFCEYLRTQLELFFETNDQANTSPSLLWDTFKAYLRGCFISFKGAKNKQNAAVLQSLERQLCQLDNENATTPSSELHKKILNLRYQYNKIISEKFSRSLMFMKQKYFEFGDKPHKLLSRQLRKLENDRIIHQIKSESNELLTFSFRN